MSYHRLLEAMHYSLTAGGKRLRPVLVLAFCAACGGDVRAALPVACAVEMVHTYSLIHDDLPCMDNDDLRRGKPTNHVWSMASAAATLAGDALQAEAFHDPFDGAAGGCARRVRAPARRSCQGENGICGGQQADMEGEGKVLTKEELMDINRKTSAMIHAACLMGVTCGGGDAQQRAAAAQYAKALGLAFQIRDDMLDVISTEAELGKPIGSDAREGKNTFMALYGLERCGAYVHELSEQAAAAVDSVFADSAFLQQLARSLADRKN